MKNKENKYMIVKEITNEIGEKKSIFLSNDDEIFETSKKEKAENIVNFFNTNNKNESINLKVKTI